MSKPPADTDGYGAPTGQRSMISSRRGSSHVAYASGAYLVVEWYDHDDDSPYESATMLVFSKASQRLLAGQIGADPESSAQDLAQAVMQRFKSYFEVREFADERAIPYERKVDFQP